MRVTHVITRLILGGAQENTVASVLGLRQKTRLQVELVSGPTRGPEGSVESAFGNAPGVLTVTPHLVRPLHPCHDAPIPGRRHRPARTIHTHFQRFPSGTVSANLGRSRHSRPAGLGPR